MILCLLRVSPENFGRILKDSTVLADLAESDDGKDQIDLDKAWDGIHWLLTGKGYIEESSESPALPIYGGRLVDEDQDMGYGPARYLDPAEAAEVAGSLGTLSKEELATRFDAKKMEKAELYPQIWDEGDEALEYLLDYFETLQEFYLDAAKKGMAVIAWVS